MADTSVTVQGADVIAAKFGRFISASPGAFDRVTGKWARGVVYKLSHIGYPPKRPGQRYVRTMNLKHSFAARRIQSSQWAIENRATAKGRLYASYVIGDNQAWMHKGRWYIMSEQVEKEVPKLTEMLNQESKRFLL